MTEKNITYFLSLTADHAMLKNFLVELLDSLQPEEIESFRVFLQSPFFNNGHNSQVLIKLYDIHVEAHKNETLAKLEKIDLYKFLFPGKVVVESKIDKLTSEIKGLLETFLITQQYLSANNEVQQLLDLTKTMRLRGLESRHRQYLEKVQGLIQSTPWQSVDGYLLLHLTALEEHEWLSTFNKSKGDLNIPEAVLNLDYYYYAQKTELKNRLLLQQRQMVLPDSANLLAEDSLEIPQTYLGGSALLDISWKINKILQQKIPNVNEFYELLNLLQGREAHVHAEKLAEFHTYLRNVCILLIDGGYSEFYPVLHEIQKDNLKRGYFTYQGKISPYTLLNIIQVALVVNNLPWANDILEMHLDKIIGENETQDFYKMNKAICLYAEKKYTEALDIIPFGSTYSTYHLLARRLELKIYYELRSDLLDFKIDAFKMFIRRAGQKLLTEQYHELYANFINILHQLNQSVGKRDKARSELLVKRINKKARIAERSWLLEKARELAR